MDGKGPYNTLEALLRDQGDAIVSRWGDAFERSRLRLPRPGARAQLAPLVRSLLEGLLLALPGPTSGHQAPAGLLQPGTPALRELEKTTAFAGASMAAAGMSGFDVAAMVASLRDVLVTAVDGGDGRAGEALAAELARLFEWLSAMAQDSFASAMGMAARERMREQLARGTPVILVASRIPAALLVGAPDALVLDTVFGRLVLLVVRTGAPAAIVDATGLDDPGAPAVIASLRCLAGHDKVAGTAEILAVGLADEHARTWVATARQAGAALRVVPRFRDAMTLALGRLGLAIASRDPS